LLQPVFQLCNLLFIAGDFWSPLYVIFRIFLYIFAIFVAVFFLVLIAVLTFPFSLTAIEFFIIEIWHQVIFNMINHFVERCHEPVEIFLVQKDFMATVSESVFSFGALCDSDKIIFALCFTYIQEVCAALSGTHFFGKYAFFSIAPLTVAIEATIISVAEVVATVAKAAATAAALKTTAAAAVATTIAAPVAETAPVAIATTTIRSAIAVISVTPIVSVIPVAEVSISLFKVPVFHFTIKFG
jgi:hypothetical protein